MVPLIIQKQSPEKLCKKVFFIDFAKFIGELFSQSLFFNQALQRDSVTGVFY